MCRFYFFVRLRLNYEVVLVGYWMTSSWLNLFLVGIYWIAVLFLFALDDIILFFSLVLRLCAVLNSLGSFGFVTIFFVFVGILLFLVLRFGFIWVCGSVSYFANSRISKFEGDVNIYCIILLLLEISVIVIIYLLG